MSNLLDRLKIEETLSRLPVCDRQKIERVVQSDGLNLHLLSPVSAKVAMQITSEGKQDKDYLERCFEK